MGNLFNKIYHNRLISRVFHTLVYCLQRELRDCESVLDIGCGPNSPVQYCEGVSGSVGIEPFIPYLEESRRKNIHTKHLNKKIEELDFPEDSFDAVVMIEVLEHLSKETGREILENADRWAKKKVVISTPNGYFPMGEVDKNPWQKHLSGWTVGELEGLGFRCYGVAGFKGFYRDSNAVESLSGSDADCYSNMRFRPRQLCSVLAALSQLVTAYAPKQSFGLFAVKSVKWF